MKTLHFSTQIEASAQAVWDTMLDSESYKEWTAPFYEGSYYEGSWEEGQRIRFVGPNGDGMIARIAVNRRHEFLSIEHLGMVKDGVEDTESEEVRKWAPAFENYTLAPVEGGTGVAVDIDVAPEYEQYMSETWPKALARLKTICEER